MTDITQTITQLPLAPTVGADDFLEKVDPFFASFSPLQTEINTWANQTNQVKNEINAKASEVSTNKDLSIQAATSAENSKNAAHISANFAGEWNTVDDFGGKSCEYNGSVYISLQTPNVNNQPDSEPTYWEQISYITKHSIVQSNIFVDANTNMMLISPFVFNSLTIGENSILKII